MTDGDNEPSRVAYGPCCVCERDADLPNIMMLPWRAPKVGLGWGCVLCKLQGDGAVAAVCVECLPDGWVPEHVPCDPPGGPIRFACASYIQDPARVPLSDLVEPFDHNMDLHTGDVDVDWNELNGEVVHSEYDNCEPFVCTRCKVRFVHYDIPPLLAWPKGVHGQGVPDGHGDIVMYRFCSECAPEVMKGAR